MKLAILPAMLLSVGLWSIPAHAVTPEHVIGRILLQVEEHGEAWYVVPDVSERVYVKNGAAAYAALRNFGLGISNAELAKIPVGLEERFEDTDTDGDGLADKLEEALATDVDDPDSDDDGFSDGEEVANGFDPLGSGAWSTDDALADRLKGHILLQVESRGEAWYVHPDDGKRYYMQNGDAAYQIMRYLSLGTSNADLETIPLLSSTMDCGDSLECMLSAVESDISAEAVATVPLNIFGVDIVTTSQYAHIVPSVDGGLYTYDALTIEQTADGVVQDEVAGFRQTCTYENKDDMVAVYENWINVFVHGTGTISTEDMNFATCETVQP